MNDEVIPLEKLGKRGTVRVYTQSYVEQLKKENAELREELTETKRLLARWIDDRPYTVSEQKDLIADTEQYLMEIKEND